MILIKSDPLPGAPLARPLEETSQARAGSRLRAAGWTATLAVAALCTLAGLWARLHRIGSKPFWLDEVTTLHRASLPFRRMVMDSLSFHHLPAYFVVTSWFAGLGHDEAALRMPAALFGALSCGLAAIAGARLAGLSAGLLAGMLMAAAPIEVQYGQEARSYTLVICLVLVALMGLIGILRAAPGRAPRGAVLAYAAGTLGGLLVLGVALSWFAVANGLALCILRGSARRRWLVLQLVIAVLAAPGFIAMIVLVERTHGTFQSGLDWIPPLSWPHLRMTFEQLYMLRTGSLIADRLFTARLPWLGPLVLALAVCGLVALRRTRAACAVLAAGVVALPVGTVLFSVVQPMFMPRYVLWSTGPFLILAGAGVAILPRLARGPVALAVAFAAFVNLGPYYKAETKPRWEIAARLVADRVAPGDLLLIDDPGAVDMMNVFLARAHRKLESTLWTENVLNASCALMTGHRVWALQGRVGQVDHEALDGFLARIAPLGPPATNERIGLDIVLMRFDRPAGPCTAQG